MEKHFFFLTGMTVGDSSDLPTGPVSVEPVVPATEETKNEEEIPPTKVASLDLNSQGKKDSESGSEASTASSFEDIKMETDELIQEDVKKEQ